MMGILFLMFMNLIGLKIKYISLFICVYIVTTPTLLKNRLTDILEYRKFNEVGNYMEQLLYSFRRHSKIGSALEDTIQIFPEGQMEELIRKGLDHINESCTAGNAYEEALEIISEEYPAEMVRRIHKYLIHVELLGGNHVKGVDLLIQDRDKWVNRVLEVIKGKSILKRNMSLATVLSLLIVSSTLIMIPEEFKNIHDNIVAQITTVTILLLNYLLWLYVQYKLSGSYIEEGEMITEESLERYYRKIEYSPYNKTQIAVVCGGGIILSIGTFMVYKNIILSILIIFLLSAVISQKYRGRLIAIKRLRREVLKAFPDWMLGIALQLQSDNVQVSIEVSLHEAPIILRKELTLLLERMEEDPLGISPYIKFYEVLELQEIQSAMKMLYVMSQYGDEEMGRQIGTLVERNSILQDRGEKLKMEDYLAGMGFFVLLPMLLGAVKMLVDMMLLITSLLNVSTGLV